MESRSAFVQILIMAMAVPEAQDVNDVLVWVDPVDYLVGAFEDLDLSRVRQDCHSHRATTLCSQE